MKSAILVLLGIIAAAAVYIAATMPKAPMSEWDWMLAHPPEGVKRENIIEGGRRNPDWAARLKDTPHREGGAP